MTVIIHFSPFQKQHVTMGSEKLPLVSRYHTISDLLIKWIQQAMTLSLALCLICVTPSHITPLLANNAPCDGSPKEELLS